MKFLLTLTENQLQRLYRRAWARMSAGDGYQPFGYDWPTLNLTKPAWAKTLRLILWAIEKKIKIENAVTVKP